MAAFCVSPECKKRAHKRTEAKIRIRVGELRVDVDRVGDRRKIVALQCGPVVVKERVAAASRRFFLLLLFVGGALPSAFFFPLLLQGASTFAVSNCQLQMKKQEKRVKSGLLEMSSGIAASFKINFESKKRLNAFWKLSDKI